ncbi:MAG: T9SS type A sorting domain-containing protein [Bacteroidota bacterium]
MKLKKLLLLLLISISFVQTSKAQITYCEPSFNQGCFNWNNKEITLDSIQWVLGSTDCAISDYTTMSTTLVKGVATPMTVLNGAWCGVGVWIDYDLNGDFDSTENLYYQYTAGDPQTYSFLILVPNTVPDGAYRMRVIAGWGTDCYTVSANGYGACGIYEYGNFDDFTVNITSNVGVKEDKLNSFSLYPNPANRNLNLSIDPDNVGNKYSIIDHMGRIVLTGTINSINSSIDINSLSEGTYLFMLKETMNTSFRVIKN